MMKKLYSALKLSFIALACLSNLQLKAQNNGSISGIITTNDNKPAEAVNVRLKEINKTALTNANGIFTLKNLKPGTYTIKTFSIGLQSQEKSVAVVAGKNTSVNFVLPESAEKLKEVVITGYRSTNQKPVSASKIAIKPMDNPQMVTVINNAVITDQQANRLSDVIKNVNGVALGTTRGSTSETFFARGYNLGSNNIFKNGSRTSNGAIPEASTLESVEVLKGSAALLYGNVSGGAVINMITKQPKFNYGGEVSMRTGSYGLIKPTGDIYGPITENLAFRIIGTYEDAGSFRNNVSSERYYINPSLLYNISNKTNILVQADYLNYNNTPDFGLGSLGNTRLATSLPRSSFFNTPWAYNKAKQTTASATINHEINSNWKINSVLGYQQYDRNYFSTERIQASAEGDWSRKLTRTKPQEDYYNGQINLNGKIKTGKIGHELLVGTDAEKYSNINNVFSNADGKPTTNSVYDEINILDPSKGNPLTYEPETFNTSRIKTPTYRFGFYAQDLISFSEKIKVLAGLRWTYQKTAVAKTYDLTNGAITNNSNGSRYDRAFSPRLGFVYQPVKSTSIFASYTNNFVTNSGYDLDKNVLKPSVVDQYEIGVKNDILNGKISANFSIYRIINDGIYVQAQFLQDGTTPNTDTNIKEFGGETTSDGAELDLTGTILPGLNVMAGYSYNFMRYTATSGKKLSYIVGERLVGNTAHTANASLFYTLQNGKLKGLLLGASAFYTGKRNAGWNNQHNDAYDYSRLIPVSGFTTIDLTAGYKFRKLSLLAKISNLTDELNYYVHENYSVNPIAPRQFMTTLSYKF